MPRLVLPPSPVLPRSKVAVHLGAWRFGRAARRGCAVAVALAAALATPSRHVVAGDAVVPAPAPLVASPGAEPSPRQAALDAAIRRLERHLTFLRKARTEIVASRPEPVAADEAARRRADVDQRGLREVARYEAARARALAALAQAEGSKDEAAIAAATGALGAVDVKFVDAMKKLEESLNESVKAAPKPDAASGAKPGTDARTDATTKAGSKAGTEAPRTRKPAVKPAVKPAMKPADAGSTFEGGSSGDEVADDDAEADEDDDDRDE